MTVRSAWHYNNPAQNPGQTRQDTRLVPIGTMTPVDAMTTRSGVMPGGTGLNLTGTGMTGTIAVGRAVVQGTSAQGAYPIAVTAAESFTVANGHASLPRVDSVFLVAYDQLYDTSGQTLAAIVYTQGTAAASPTAPTAPATGTAYLKLWDIAVPAGASAGSPINWGTALTDRRQYTVAAGGINPGGSSVAGAYAGQYRDGGGASGILERYTGSAWESRLYLGTSGQLVIGTDVNLYRDSANVLRTDDSMTAVSYKATSMASAYVEDLTSRTTTSTSYTAVSTLAATIVVPPSGRVAIDVYVNHYNNGTAQSYSDVQVVGSVSGTLRSPTDTKATVTANFTSAGATAATGTIPTYQPSANPGETLTITLMHRVTGGTGQWSYRSIRATPLLG
jgi:hypothetical protein